MLPVSPMVNWIIISLLYYARAALSVETSRRFTAFKHTGAPSSPGLDRGGITRTVVSKASFAAMKWILEP